MIPASSIASRGTLLRVSLLTAIIALTTGCGEQPPAETAHTADAPRAATRGPSTDGRTWRTLSDSDLTDSHRAQLAQATAARDAMFGNLTRALMQAMGSAGPAGAIDACRIEAPAIATRTAGDRNVRIGRTSWKLRNPENTPPQWAHAFLEARPGEPRHALADDGTFAALLPIRMMSLCLTCHGDMEMIPADVRGELARHYPDDQATGFKDGDLRGWFWIEVPVEG